ncbi:uncharacterized protein BDCG_05477 [Blastomyces dermatitidis ER-3]|uniref:IBR domain-containing protein n=1 Tax=Ajellomyces dermatitidis (strain ER-3 / ATCC MYA-2586) TaxID=559297 RepID=A0ABP2F4R1_AJEDR|nr:uncharacterized protein BDCG_05477 [Blastomyces dermatitidis ER-3]EEQ90357.2 hypothetical protein BDCG_05477 [Blastomyces dermatitidis ER-3]
MTIITQTENFSVKFEHTVQRSTVASFQGAPNQASAPVLQLLKRGGSYFVSAGTGKLLEASLSDLMSSWAVRFSRSCPLSSGHLHITSEKTSFPRAVTLSFYRSHTRTMTIPSEALNTWPGRIIQGQNTRQSSGGQCMYAWRVGSAVTMSFLPGFISILAFIPAVEGHTGKLVRCFYFTKIGEPLSTQTVTLGTAASKVILVLREMDKDLTSDRKIRKRASTRAIQENAEPNKRTDRSQDQDDDQITAHDLLNKIRGKSQTKEGYVQRAVRQRLRLYCCGCEEDVSGGGECQQCGHTSCLVCLHERRLRRERSVDRSHEPNQANRRHDAQTNNQTRAVPATLSQAIKIDEDPETETDSVLYMLPYSKLKRKLREQQQKQQTWVNRAIKCCSCEVTGSAVNKCACGHEYCGICFHYSVD